MTAKSDRLSALLALYHTLRDESLKSIEWRLTLFSAGFGAIVAVAAGAVAIQINTTDSRVVLFALSYIIPLICIFVLINWMGEASRCQRVSYFLAAEVEPKINQLIGEEGEEVVNWEISLNSGKLRRDELFGPSMIALSIVGLLGGITPVLGIKFVYKPAIITPEIITSWLFFPYAMMSIAAAYVAGHINRLKNVDKIESINTLSYRNKTAFSVKIALTVLVLSLASSSLFCWAVFTY